MVQPQAAHGGGERCGSPERPAWAFVVRMATHGQRRKYADRLLRLRPDMKQRDHDHPGNADKNEGFNHASVGRWKADEALSLC